MFFFKKFKDPDSKVCKKHAVVRHRCGSLHVLISTLSKSGRTSSSCTSRMCTQLPASISRTPLEFRLLIIQIRWLVMCSRYDFDQTSKGVKNTFQRAVAHASQRNWTQTQSKRPQTKLNHPDPNKYRNWLAHQTEALPPGATMNMQHIWHVSSFKKARQHPTLDEHTVTHGIVNYHAPIYLRRESTLATEKICIQSLPLIQWWHRFLTYQICHQTIYRIVSYSRKIGIRNRHSSNSRAGTCETSQVSKQIGHSSP